MKELLDKIPRLYRITNIETSEVHYVFAKNQQRALDNVPSSECLSIMQVLILTEDGCMCPVYRLKDLPTDETSIYFRTVNQKTLKPGKTVMVKEHGCYDHSTKKYCCYKFSDINSFRDYKPNHWVIADFTF